MDDWTSAAVCWLLAGTRIELHFCKRNCAVHVVNDYRYFSSFARVDVDISNVFPSGVKNIIDDAPTVSQASANVELRQVQHRRD